MTRSSLDFIREGAHPKDDQRIERLARHLGEVPELTALVVTGHLLLEEMLSEVLSKCFAHSDLVLTARLTFAQKLKLARAASWDQQDNEVWAIIKTLNEVRNDLAHELESPRLAKKLARLRNLNSKRYPDEAGDDDEQIVRSCVAHSAGFLSECILEAYEIRRLLNAAVHRLLALDNNGPAV